MFSRLLKVKPTWGIPVSEIRAISRISETTIAVIYIERSQLRVRHVTSSPFDLESIVRSMVELNSRIKVVDLIQSSTK